MISRARLWLGKFGESWRPNSYTGKKARRVLLPILIIMGLTAAHLFRGPPAASPPVTLRLNLPAYRLEVLRDSQVVQRFPVAIGAKKYRTPTGDFEITRIVWNPWWYPPDAPWARDEKVTAPGPDNPMGKVKVLIGGPYYLHGTPFPASIGKAASHGCLRMHNSDAIELARLLQRYAGALISEDATDSLAGPLDESRVVDLPIRIPVRLVYQLAEVRDGVLEVFPDIYRGKYGSTRGHILAALAAAAYDTSRIDRRALNAVIRKSARAPVTTPVDSVMWRQALVSRASVAGSVPQSPSPRLSQ